MCNNTEVNTQIPKTYGVSLSLKQCSAFQLDPAETLDWLLFDAGFRRFRLMSYWDESESTKGQYNFSDLDWQMDEAAKRGAKVSLACIE